MANREEIDPAQAAMSRIEVPIPFPVEAEEEAYAEDTMVLNMGPQHPSTHGVLRLVLELDGEVVVKCTPVIGYLHRGKEKIAENFTYNQFIPYTDRMDYLAPLHNNVAVVLATEALAGIEVPKRCQYIRTICCELSRISAHMLGLGAYAMDVGAMTVFLYTFVEREKIYYLIERLTGARFTTSYTRVGGVAQDLPLGWIDELRRFLKQVDAKIDEIDALLTRNRIWQIRNQGVGVISKEDAIRYNLRGPVLRASGVPFDLRKDHPYLVYDEVEFDVPIGSEGDCYDRYLCRMEEMRQSVSILRQCCDQIPDGPIWTEDAKVALPPKERVLTSMEELIHQFILVTESLNIPEGEFYHGVENPKGEFGIYVVSRGGPRPHRFRMSVGSFANLAILPYLTPGHMISDVVAILGSIDMVMGECDR
jgi:NADH-quinone oxidoreductase subunit D